MRESFHSQILRPANITKASTLGQSGIWCPATSTSGCITTRNNCAKLINPNTMLATPNPRTWELMLVPLPLGSRISFRRLTTDVQGPNPVGRQALHQEYRCRFWAPPNDYLVSIS